VPVASMKVPAVTPETPVARDPVETGGIVISRRSRGPLVVTGVAMLAVGVALVIAIRRQAAPSSSGPPAPLAPPQLGLGVASPPTPVPSAPDAAVVVASPAPSPRAAEVAPAPPVTAELVVEPEAASLAVDGHRVKLVGGRASLALPPGDHTAIATLGRRSARKQFAVTVDHLAAVSLRVPEAEPSVVPRNPPPSSDNVDAVHNPFPR